MKTAIDLKAEVENWVNKTFNFIELEVYEKMHDNMLIDYIRPSIITDEDAEAWYESLDEDEQESVREDLNLEDGEIIDFNEVSENFGQIIREWNEENYFIENYPMWNTIFEFRFNPSESWLEKAQEIGLGVIESTDYFNASLFAMSAGHSFYSSYWIPLYLSLFQESAEEYAGVDYSGM